MKSNKRIFVHIASYRDPELQNTVDTVIKNADYPENISVGICQQSNPNSFLTFSYANVKTINFDYLDSKGACWARYLAAGLYNDEEYFLQIDSHVIMTEHWDTLLIEQMDMAAKLTANRCIFAMYPTAYEIENGVRVLGHPSLGTTEIDQPIIDIPVGKAGVDSGSAVPAQCTFLNAGFMFGHGSFYKDCEYDPEIYFIGEEILNTLKAYTNGYDLFNPTVHFCWHLYKHHDDPNSAKWNVHWNTDDEQQRSVKYTFYATRGAEKTRKILRDEIPGYLGTARSLQDFEKYIGFSLNPAALNKYATR
jgi:hypothetical protein